MIEPTRIQRTLLFAISLLVASFCGLAIFGHERAEVQASVAQNCAAACHTHNQTLGGGTVGLRQFEEDDQEPVPPQAYWPQFAAALYLLAPLVVAPLLYRQKVPVFLMQQKLRF